MVTGTEIRMTRAVAATMEQSITMTLRLVPGNLASNPGNLRSTTPHDLVRSIIGGLRRCLPFFRPIPGLYQV